jgi:hypothetical protein
MLSLTSWQETHLCLLWDTLQACWGPTGLRSACAQGAGTSHLLSWVIKIISAWVVPLCVVALLLLCQPGTLISLEGLDPNLWHHLGSLWGLATCWGSAWKQHADPQYWKTCQLLLSSQTGADSPLIFRPPPFPTMSTSNINCKWLSLNKQDNQWTMLFFKLQWL